MEKSISQSNIKNALKLISMYTNKTSRRKKLLGGSYRTTQLEMGNILQEQSVILAGSNSYLKRKTRSSKGTC